MPSVYIDSFFIGGLNELETLESTGNLLILINNLKKAYKKSIFKQCICIN